MPKLSFVFGAALFTFQFTNGSWAQEGVPPAKSSELPRLETNQTYIEEATRTTSLAINDPIVVFAFVLNSLPDRVKVYPTENCHRERS